MALPVIDSLDALCALVRERPVCVRFSDGPDADARRGWRSWNHQTGAAERGLSVNNLRSRYGTVAHGDCGFVAQQLREYAALSLGGTGYLLTGEECGRGSDNEPLLADCRPLAIVGPNLLAEAQTVDADGRVCRHPADRHERYTTGVVCAACNQWIERY